MKLWFVFRMLGTKVLQENIRKVNVFKVISCLTVKKKIQILSTCSQLISLNCNMFQHNHLAKYFEKLVVADDRFETFCETKLALVCFRLKVE